MPEDDAAALPYVRKSDCVYAVLQVVEHPLWIRTEEHKQVGVLRVRSDPPESRRRGRIKRARG